MYRVGSIVLYLWLIGCSIFPQTAAFVPPPHASSASSLFSTKRESASRPNSKSKKWDRHRDGKKGGNVQRRPRPIVPRPQVTNYEENRNLLVNEGRLSDAINCEHFGTCPACVVNANVGTVDIIQSAKVYCK
jgi:hypothetical protein